MGRPKIPDAQKLIANLTVKFRADELARIKAHVGSSKIGTWARERLLATIPLDQEAKS